MGDIATIPSTSGQGYRSCTDVGPGTYADCNVDGGNAGANEYNLLFVTPPFAVGDWEHPVYSGSYFLNQLVVKFDIDAKIAPGSTINSVTMDGWINNVFDQDAAWTIEVREHAPVTVEAACSTSTMCAPLEGFYKGSNITSNTTGLLGSFSTSSFSSAGSYAFTVDPQLQTSVASGGDLWVHISSSRNRLELEPSVGKYNYASMGEAIGIASLTLTVDYTPATNGFFMGANF